MNTLSPPDEKIRGKVSSCYMMLFNARNSGTALLSEICTKLSYPASSIMGVEPLNARAVSDLAADCAFPQCKPTLAFLVFDVSDIMKKSSTDNGATLASSVEAVNRMQRVFRSSNFSICICSTDVKREDVTVLEDAVETGTCRFMYCTSYRQVSDIIVTAVSAYSNLASSDAQRAHFLKQKHQICAAPTAKMITHEALSRMTVGTSESCTALIHMRGVSLERIALDEHGLVGRHVGDDSITAQIRAFFGYNTV